LTEDFHFNDDKFLGNYQNKKKKKKKKKPKKKKFGEKCFLTRFKLAPLTSNKSNVWQIGTLVILVAPFEQRAKFGTNLLKEKTIFHRNKYNGNIALKVQVKILVKKMKVK
jgi:hypothetical protein